LASAYGPSFYGLLFAFDDFARRDHILKEFRSNWQTTGLTRQSGDIAMATFFRRILCPIEFDDASIAALQYARDLARQNDATLCVMHVVYVPVAHPDFPNVPYPVNARLEAEAAFSEEPSKLELQKIASKHLEGSQYELITRSGKPVEIIIQTAEDLHVDLIVMATHGRRGLPRLFLGSVAEQVLRASDRPVLTIRPEQIGG
jgi:universal stress protein A